MGYRIVFATLGSLGDVFPYVAIALGLKARGHETILATHAPYRDFLTKIGLESVALRPDSMPANVSVSKLLDDRSDASQPVSGQSLVAEIANTYRDLFEATRNADLMVTHSLVLPAPLLARKTGIPWISVALAPAYFLPVLDRRMEGVRAWLQPYLKLETDLGLRPGSDSLIQEQYSSEVVLVLASKLLAGSKSDSLEQLWMTKVPFLLSRLLTKDHSIRRLRRQIRALPGTLLRLLAKPPQPQWPPHVRFTGFPFLDHEAIADEAVARLEQFLSDGPAPVVFTLGSSGGQAAGSFFTESVEAAKRLRCRALFLTGTYAVPREIEELQSRDLAVFRYIPYSHVFPRAAVIVHPAGIGTTALSLRAGRPMLVVPMSFDQPDTAARMCRLGVARMIPHAHYQARWAAAELRALRGNPTYASAAARVRRQIDSEEGVSNACDAIEEYLARNRESNPSRAPNPRYQRIDSASIKTGSSLQDGESAA